MNRQQRFILTDVVIKLEEYLANLKEEHSTKTIIDLEELGLLVHEMADAEQEKYDNAPDGLIDSEMYESIQENADDLYDAADDIDSATDDLRNERVNWAMESLAKAIESINNGMR